jgi:hypothetical protein
MHRSVHVSFRPAGDRRTRRQLGWIGLVPSTLQARIWTSREPSRSDRRLNPGLTMSAHRNPLREARDDGLSVYAAGSDQFNLVRLRRHCILDP